MNKLIEGWYALYTMPRHEKKLHTRLSELNVTSHLPTVRVLRNWHDRKKYLEMPLFPSYIFIYLNNIEHYYNVLNTNGALIKIARRYWYGSACYKEVYVAPILLSPDGKTCLIFKKDSYSFFRTKKIVPSFQLRDNIWINETKTV
jgi:hypothetical protein